MPDTDKFKKRIRAGRVPGVAGPPRGMPKGSVAGDIIGAPRKRQLMVDHKRVEDNIPKKARYGYRGTDNPKRATHTKKLTTYDKKKPATKKKPKKKKPVVRMPIPEYRRPTPKTKKRIKGTLRDNLPIFGGPGRVPEG